jgi:uncharacterized protein (TIGR02147 family)
VGTALQARSKIFEYTDFREYLRDTYKSRKDANPAFSYRYIAGKIGLDAGSFSRILKGERKLDPEIAERLSKVFSLNQQEQDFFITLVLYGQAKSHAEKNHFLEKIFRHRGVKVGALEERQHEFYREWYYSSIRELMNFYDFDGDFKKLGKMLRPAIRPVDAKKAFGLLETLGLLEKQEDGKVRLPDKLITSGNNIRAVSVNNLHLNMAQLAIKAIEDVNPSERDISGLTLSLSANGFEKLKYKLKLFRREILELAQNDDDVNCVYQVNLQTFPLSHPSKAGQV